MKKTVPLIITFVVGALAFASFFVPAAGLSETMHVLKDFAGILAAAAFVLGGINVLQVNVPHIQRKRPDWGYKIVLLISAAITLLVGVKWHEWWSRGDKGSISISPLDHSLSGKPEAADTAILFIDAKHRDGMIVKLDGQAILDEHKNPARLPIEGPIAVELDGAGQPKPHTIVFEDVAKRYEIYETTITVAPGGRAEVRSNSIYLWGPDGQLSLWIFEYVFAPCNATMFALLAFFITSAAFRAFRARNLEAILLLSAAMLVMVGTIPIGAHYSDTWLLGLQEWILAVPTVAGRRAILMGAALGGIAIGLRIILGLERSHLGGD